MKTALWSALAALALLWPARLTGVLDGVPFDGRAEAVVIGVIAPAVWWLDRQVVAVTWVRVLIVALLVWKSGMSGIAAQQGLCLAAFAKTPLDGANQGIPIVEPSGALRSWDVRADWRDPQPECTAILTRPLPAQAAFPAWFLNVTPRRDFNMAVRGSVTTAQPRTLSFDLGSDVQLTGRVDQLDVAGAPLVLDAGTHTLDLSMAFTGDAWRFEPKLDDAPLWRRALVTATPPRAIDRVLAPWAWLVTPLLVAALVGGAAIRLARRLQPDWPLLLWVAGATAAAVALALWTDARWHRAAGLIGAAAIAVPVRARLRNLRGAFLLVGVPWLAFFVAWSIRQVGQFSIYSYDDWLTYQVAGYRIYMHGYWLEGGNAVFDFQPLYRWMTGALHLVFGDSSVGEVYWDATCLLIGALLAFSVVRATAGFRWGLVAAIATLATFTLGTPWYFFGRGLSEIAAAGWSFLAMFFLLRGRRGSVSWIAAAGVMAVLMFYTRLNHLLLAFFLPALLLPLRVPAVAATLARALGQVRHRRAVLFLGVFSTGVLLFMLRTWYYTGVFSLFYGTSLRHNDTGLRPWTLFDGEVWTRVAHSLANFVFMNEPPRPDPRAIVMVAGAAVLAGAWLQVPVLRRVPAALAIAGAGASVAAFLAHAHGYPGRFSVHMVPIAAALAAIAAARLASLRGLPGFQR